MNARHDKRQPRRLVLVDGSSYLYRAFHALPPLTNSRGQPTGAVYGVANMLRKLLNDYQPDRIAVVMDAKGPTFRDELYEHYKANRPPMPDDMQVQVQPLRELIQAWGLPLLEVSGVEADDVIGTLVEHAAARGIESVVSTGDKDMAQLVGPRVTLVNTMSNTTMNRDGVIEKFGVPPERIIDYLALVGDSSDNIPGIPKVGPKTAAKWLQQYGSLDAIIQHAGDIGGKVGESLREHIDRLDLSRELATIRRDLDLNIDLEMLQQKAPDRERLVRILRELEFTRWLEQVLEDEDPEQEQKNSDGDYVCIRDETELGRWIERLQKAELICFDTETTSLHYMSAQLVGISLAIDDKRAAYIPLGHDYAGVPPQLPRASVLERLKPLFEDPGRPKLGHHIKYDMHVLENCGIHLEGIAHDTMLESYVLDSTLTNHSLDSLALKHLGHKNISYEEVAGKGARQINFSEVDIDTATRYAAEDAHVTYRLHTTFWPKLEAVSGLRDVYQTTEIPLVAVLQRMERTGVLVDTERLHRQSRELEQRLSEVASEAYQIARKEFNLASPKQIQEILFEESELPVLQKTPKGQPSTAESVLQELALDYPLPKLILEYRALAKLKSTYTDRLPEQVDSRTGRVHTSYHQAVAATGRLSSSDPNLQNIPVRTAEGRRIRQAFVAPPGYQILAADYSQIELRIMAHLSGDPGLLAAFAEGRDIHRATAAEVFGLKPEAVTDERRRSAKAINFGLIYGMSAFGLARQLGIDRGAAQDYVDRYFARYPGVKAFMDRTREQAREQGYVETVFGRRLYLPEIQSRNQQRQRAAERTAINAPMQGSAADIIKRAMIDVDAWIRAEAPKLKMVMQVHDELVFEVHRDAVADASKQIVARMISAAQLSVPLVVDAGSGRNWDEAH